eukprot:gene9462-9272_t
MSAVPGQDLASANSLSAPQVISILAMALHTLHQDVFAELLSTLPETYDLAVTHGDAGLPNFMVEASRFTGYIDCGRLGISDIYQDLALAARSIESNLGPAWIGNV